MSLVFQANGVVEYVVNIDPMLEKCIRGLHNVAIPVDSTPFI